ncbi:galactokinase [Litorihabitans aurantiacus]|uniref:Galactokinase n=1 Tax=Litorihabitans aurantiacus TaxID=1930061 RepID=A0AA37XF59_9MICO|nr:galactokinase [Litorihabitans aurantiacus]GMA32177.1 galactokinase [Litorihabitans aurantiacus]
MTTPPTAATPPSWLPAWTLEQGRELVTTLFGATFDGAPAGTFSAPGRVNLIGEHTDYNGGLALPIALEHRTHVALRLREDSRVRLVSAQGDGVWEADLEAVAPGAVTGWGAYLAGVAWALRQAGHDVPGFEAAVDSCVPFGAGLSSSAALEASLAIGLDALLDLGLGADDAGRSALAAVCVRAENEIAGAATGGMDQAASLRARDGYALALDCLDGSVSHEPFVPAGCELLVIDTRAPHSLNDGQYASRRATCDAAAAALGVPTLRHWLDAAPDAASAVADAQARLDDDVARRRVRHVLTEIDRTRLAHEAMRAGDWSAFGTLMDASHESLRVDYEVTVPELDVAVGVAREAGALGARMTGGGFGGSAIALVPGGTSDAVAAAVVAAYAERGFAAPAFLTSRAAGPAA